MKIIGLLNFYDEHPAWLAACISSAAKLCDHLVAVDGAYFAFPHTRCRSGPEQHETIIRTCDGLGIGCTLHIPAESWYGNEVEKRDYMFRLGEALAEPFEDWYLRIDADEVMVECPSGSRGALNSTDADVGAVTLWEREVNPDAVLQTGQADYRSPLRCLFRVLEDMHVEDAHYNVTGVRDGQKLYLAEEPPADLSSIVLEHHTYRRDKGRIATKQIFNERRERLGLETCPS